MDEYDLTQTHFIERRACMRPNELQISSTIKSNDMTWHNAKWTRWKIDFNLLWLQSRSTASSVNEISRKNHFINDNFQDLDRKAVTIYCHRCVVHSIHGIFSHSSMTRTPSSRLQSHTSRKFHHTIESKPHHCDGKFIVNMTVFAALRS